MPWLDKLTSLLPKKQIQKEYFLALILRENNIKATIFEEQGGQVTIIDKSIVSAEKNLEDVEVDELLKLVDQAIGVAEKTLPTSTKTTKTIFGLNDWWVEETVIKEPYLSKIKKISKDLELTPMGFVVIPEAISHLLALEEGMPPTVLLVFLGEDHVGVTLVRAGRIETSKTMPKEGRSDSETAAAIIKSFVNIEILPSRMLLFDGQIPLEEAKQEFLSYQWSKKLSFLHFPKIDIAQEDFDAKAVVSGAAKELGFAFEEEKIESQATEKAADDSGQPKQEKEVVNRQSTAVIDEKKDRQEEETFGFVHEHDVGEEKNKPPEPLPPTVADDDIDDKQPQAPSFRPSSLSSPIGMIGKKMRTIQLPSLHFAIPKALSTSLWISITAVVAVFILAVGLLVFIPSATLVFSPQTRSLEKDIEIIIDVDSSSIDNEKKKIPAKLVEIKQEGEKTEKTTGKKTVGDLAKGEITIYNKTENRKVFLKGTVLTGSENLRFTLDEEVTIASTSAFELTPSSVKAKVTADQIGEEGNLPAGTNFPFKDFPTSSYFAKNEAAFSGGNKRDAIVVSKEDQENLLTTLTEELRNKAKEELSKDSQENRIIDVDIKEEVITKKYSKNIGDESETISLALSLTFSTLAYKESDLLGLVENEITKAIPAGFIFQKDKFETAIKTATQNKDGTTSVRLRYKALLFPDFNQETIRTNIAGKTKTAVEAYLKSLPLEKHQISQNIELPPPFDLLPLLSENIKIEVQSN